ncbi:MAG: 2Fe-2S iron-sulfur cluster binding domain-containing protein [Lachnospiraceae bacterium]|nr:2Fe-2S iron-sulfur cluster binding domain-containing protein [Lachnospiraceae bacterium]
MQQYEITYKETGDKFYCKEDESLLACMRRNNNGPVQIGCFGGGCGRCKVQILEGEYHKFKKMSRAHISEEDEKQGIVLACCIKPRGSITVTTAPN